MGAALSILKSGYKNTCICNNFRYNNLRTLKQRSVPIMTIEELKNSLLAAPKNGYARLSADL